MNDAQIKHMVDRFLAWKLPGNFSPDGGISFDPPVAVAWPWPIGTNLLDATQVTAMVQHMVSGLPANEVPEPNPEWEAKAAAHHAESEAVRGQLASDEVTNDAAPSTDSGNG